jgi:hypothetical protein
MAQTQTVTKPDPDATNRVKVAANPPTEFSFIELIEPLTNCSLRDRKSQRVNQLRPDADVWFKEHAHGVEVCGRGAWRGVIPWANIKVALR